MSRDGKSSKFPSSETMETVAPKTRIASLGMPLILLTLMIERKGTLDSLSVSVVYDGRNYSHQHRPSVSDTDVAS